MMIDWEAVEFVKFERNFQKPYEQGSFSYLPLIYFLGGIDDTRERNGDDIPLNDDDDLVEDDEPFVAERSEFVHLADEKGEPIGDITGTMAIVKVNPDKNSCLDFCVVKVLKRTSDTTTQIQW